MTRHHLAHWLHLNRVYQIAVDAHGWPIRECKACGVRTITPVQFATFARTTADLAWLIAGVLAMPALLLALLWWLLWWAP